MTRIREEEDWAGSNVASALEFTTSMDGITVPERWDDIVLFWLLFLLLHVSNKLVYWSLLRVDLGELAADQLKVHINHCPHFYRHHEIVYLLTGSSIFYSLVHQMHANANILR